MEEIGSSYLDFAPEILKSPSQKASIAYLLSYFALEHLAPFV